MVHCLEARMLLEHFVWHVCSMDSTANRIIRLSLQNVSFWVLAAVTIGGNLMGIIGMLIFIPLVSVFYTIFREFVYLRLKKQHIKRVTRTDVEEYAEEEIASSFIVPNEK